MRTDIFEMKKLPNGRLVREINIKKVFGRGYGSGLFFNNHCRYRFFKGARNTKKSKDVIGYEPIFKILTNELRNILMLRQNDVDNRQTTFENLKGCIYDLGLEKYFSIIKNPLQITYNKTGQQIVFRGMNNPTSINSLTFAHGFLTDIYIEESYEVTSYDDYKKVDGSLRGRMPKGLYQQITCCFNAWNKGHWMYDMFFKEQSATEENVYLKSSLVSLLKEGEKEDDVIITADGVVRAKSNEKKFRLKEDGTSIRVLCKENEDYKELEYRVFSGKAKESEKFVFENAYIVNTLEEFEEGIKNGTFLKMRNKIIAGLEDDFEYLDRPDVTHDYYYNPNYVGRYGKGLFLHTSTYKINEFRDIENYDVAMENMKELYLEGYKVEALGMWGNSSGSTYPCFDEAKCYINLNVATGKELPYKVILDERGNYVQASGVNTNESDRYKYMNFAIGIDTGLSNGEGKHRQVKKGEDPLTRVRSATTMCLVGVTNIKYNIDGSIRDNKIVAIDEFFHSNDKAYADLNSDGNIMYKDPVELAKTLIKYIDEWRYMFQDNIMKGTINIYVDNADIGFRQVLELEANRYGIGRFLNIMGSTKLPIQSRVDFENELMAYENLKIVTDGGLAGRNKGCANLIREIKNSRKGDKGEAREDRDDHEINAFEYAWAPLRADIESWKNFKIR